MTPDGWLRLFFCRSAEGRCAARRPPASACASRLVRRLLPSGASLCCAQLAAHPAQPRPVCSGTHSGELLKRPPACLRSSSGRTACSALLPFRTALRLPLASRGRFARCGPAALSSHYARLQPVRGPCPVRRSSRPRPAPGARCALLCAIVKRAHAAACGPVGGRPPLALRPALRTLRMMSAPLKLRGLRALPASARTNCAVRPGE